MCRNIKTLFNFEPPATEEEIRASALELGGREVAHRVEERDEARAGRDHDDRPRRPVQDFLQPQVYQDIARFFLVFHCRIAPLRREALRQALGRDAIADDVNKFNRTVNLGQDLARWFEAQFASTSHAVLNSPAYTGTVGATPSIIGMKISGFVSPVGLSVPYSATYVSQSFPLASTAIHWPLSSDVLPKRADQRCEPSTPENLATKMS